MVGGEGKGGKGELPFNKNNFTFAIDSGNLRTIKAAILTQKHHLIHSCAVFNGRILRDNVQNFFKGVLSVFNHCSITVQSGGCMLKFMHANLMGNTLLCTTHSLLRQQF